MNTLVNTLTSRLKPGATLPAKLNRWLPGLFSLLLVIACSYSLSQITWLLIPSEETGAPEPQEALPEAAPRTQNHSAIINAHLFGVYQQSNTPAPSNRTDAPDTRLNLVLKGILAATPAEMASVIIALGKGGKEDNYSIGDKVSSATIREIHDDRVILERSGRLETLRMPKEFSNSLIQSAPSGNNTSRQVSESGRVLSDIRSQIIRNPASFRQFAMPVPHRENGNFVGYRLQPTKDKRLFDTVGLQENDVIVAVNGVELDTPANGLKAIRKLQNAKQVNLTVLRNGTEMPLNIALP